MEKSLHSGIEFKKLKIAFDDFRKISFPEPPIADELYDIYSEIVEFDAYIAGLISSLINNRKINKCDLHMDENIKQNLINFKTTDKQTKKELSIYINYLNKLEELINMTLNLMQ
jgi:hypothetical protein